MSSGSLRLISMSSRSKERNAGQEILYTHAGTGTRGRAGSAGIKGASKFLTWKVTRKERDPDGHAVRGPSWPSSLEEVRTS